MIKYDIITAIGLILFFVASALALGLGLSIGENGVSYHVALKFIGIAILFICSLGSIFYSEIKKLNNKKME